MPTCLIENALIFDGHTANILADHYVLIENGYFTAITPDRPDMKIDRSLDLGGRFMMPGLIDAHFHAYGSSINFPQLETMPISYLSQHARLLLEGALRRGFTTVRDAGGADHGLWLATQQNLFPSPRLFFSGRALSQTGGHGDVRAPHVEPCGCSLIGNLAEVVDGVDNIRKAVRETLRQGAHQIKVMVSGGVASPSDPIWMVQYAEDEIRAVVEEATRKRSYVMAHAYTAETISRAVKAGVRSIEHGNLIDRDTAACVVEHGAYVVPTLSAYDALMKHADLYNISQAMLDKLQEVRNQGARAVELCRKAGVKLGFGTDLLGDLHKFQREEFRLRSEIDSPYDVLHSATAVNAEILQMSDLLGAIRVGAYADFLVLDGNPLEDISIFYPDSTKINAVFKAGEQVV